MTVRYEKMPDGTIKQVHPITGTEVWHVPGRRSRPKNDKVKSYPLEKQDQENYCNFCEARLLKTPPEKARMVKQGDRYTILKNVKAEQLFNTQAEFRRIPNLFEIVTYNYWVKNYDYHLSNRATQHKTDYISSAEGMEHVINVIDTKLQFAGKSNAEIASIPLQEKLTIANAFFGGGHEVITARRHYKADAKFDNELFSSGEMTPEEHYRYFLFTIETIRCIFDDNRYVRYISVFQNWLSSAGASFDHLHKQLVAIDEWGTAMEREIAAYRENENIYNEDIVNFAGYHNLVLAENDYAIAFVEVGRRYPTVSIYSKSIHSMPEDHTKEEIMGVSDIVHGCHAAIGNHIPCNEEWFYSPVDARENIPWHISIRWRTHQLAGFEGGTRIYINPMSPEELRDYMVPRLFELKNTGKIAVFPIASECPANPNSLMYVEGFKPRRGLK